MEDKIYAKRAEGRPERSPMSILVRMGSGGRGTAGGDLFTQSVREGG
jgi:hypothetical protein